MEITIDFTYPIQDSVSVGDVAYYVYTNGSGGFDINSANVVEIGEVLNINRFGVSGGNITCNTELYGNELEIGCGGCNCDVALNNHCGGCTCFECGGCVATTSTSDSGAQSQPPTVIECELSFGEYMHQSNALVGQIMGLHNNYISNPSVSLANEMETFQQQLLTLTQTAWDCGACVETPGEYEPSNCCHIFASMSMTIEQEADFYLNNPTPTSGSLNEWYGDMVSFVTELQNLSCEGSAQEVAQEESQPPPPPSTPSSEDCGPPFILFSKNNCQNLKSLLGYYSLFRFVNNSKDKAELFNVTVDAYESSK